MLKSIVWVIYNHRKKSSKDHTHTMDFRALRAAPGGGRQRAPHLKPAAKSVATCTAAALSRSDRSLS